jgi:hypothetical protein
MKIKTFLFNIFLLFEYKMKKNTEILLQKLQYMHICIYLFARTHIHIAKV